MSAASILEITTQGRGFKCLTAAVNRRLADGPPAGLCHLFLQHTSASLMLSENADPQVLDDLERWMQARVPDGDPMFGHTAEGPDDMPAHVRTLLAGHELTIPFADHQLLLGTWQGIYLWEHRAHGHRRRVVISRLAGA